MNRLLGLRLFRGGSLGGGSFGSGCSSSGLGGILFGEFARQRLG